MGEGRREGREGGKGGREGRERGGERGGGECLGIRIQHLAGGLSDQ